MITIFNSSVQLFLLFMARLLGMMFVAPFFSSLLITNRFRLILALAITLVAYPVLAEKLSMPIVDDWMTYVLMLISEIMVGVCLGLMISIVFTSFQVAGQFFSFQMGLGISEIFDPTSQYSLPVISHFLLFTLLFLFLHMDGPIALIDAIYQSYLSVPVFSWMESAEPVYKQILFLFSDMFVIALRISLPIMGTLLIMTLSMGLLAKFAPQTNILMFGFSVYSLVGFGVLVFLIPSMMHIGRQTMERSIGYLFKFF